MLPVRQTGCPQFLQRLIDHRKSDRAPLDIDNFPAVFFKESDPALCGVDGDPVSECIRVWGSESGQYLDIGDAANPLQELDDLAALQFELMTVGDVLVIAASALTKIRADRVDPLSRANDHLSELGPIKALFAFDHLGLDPFPIDCERYENDFPFEASYAGSAERDVINVKPDRRL